LQKAVAAPNESIEEVLALTGGRRRRRRLALLLTLVAALAAGAGIIWWWGAGSGSSAVQYQTVAARRGDLTVTVSATGTVEPVNTVEVGSELSGTVRSVTADYNDPVTVGQVLAEIDTDKLAAQTDRTRALLDAARAGGREAEAALAQAENELARVRPLAERDIASQQALLTAETNLARAEAALATANAQVRVAEADLAVNVTELSKAEIRSPVGGIVLDRNVEPGQTVAASLQAPILFTIAEDLRQMHLLVDVDEADAGSVREGQLASFTVEAFPDRSFPAEVIQLRYAPSTVSGVVTYKAVLSVDNTDMTLLPGMTASAEIVSTRSRKRSLFRTRRCATRRPPKRRMRRRAPAASSAGCFRGRRRDRAQRLRPPRRRASGPSTPCATGASCRSRLSRARPTERGRKSRPAAFAKGTR
jgi:HlyD family secretion protein